VLIFRIPLFLPAHAFVGLSILVHINNLSGVLITFVPMPIRVLELRAVPDSAISVAIAGFAICSHFLQFYVHLLKPLLSKLFYQLINFVMRQAGIYKF
jgi:hypothetical protein